MKKAVLILMQLALVAAFAADDVKKSASEEEMDMSDFVSHTLSRKSADTPDVSCDSSVEVSSQKQTFHVDIGKMGPLPLLLQVKNGAGEIVYSEKREFDSASASLSVAVSKLENGSLIEVYNGFEERQYCRTVTLK